jgi:hypothetical protein
MQTKEVIESVLKVCSLIIVLNGNCGKKVHATFRGEKGEKGETPYTSGK